jgi:hypothetical protein
MNIDVVQDQGTVIHTYLKRTKHGVMVDVIVAPEVEEFFQYWGTGKAAGVGLNGRAWKHFPPVKEGEVAPELMAWQINGLRDDVTGAYDIYSVGRSLTNLSERGQNISFIRLVGASKGVKFLYEDVVSWDGLNTMAERIRTATGRFYDQFIRPAHLQITVTTDIKRLE